MSFALDPKLEADTFALGDFLLCRVLLMNDARWPWLILVPRRESAVEIDDLTEQDLALLIQELATATRVMRGFDGVEKVNVGALGNIVRQLHVHVVGRRRDDAAWPGPVWSAGQRVPYNAAEMDIRRLDLAARLKIAPP